MEKEKNSFEELHASEIVENTTEGISPAVLNALHVPDLGIKAPAKNTKVSEIREFRAANRKVFSMKDGSEQAVFYPNAIHKLDAETQTFEDVDNSLKEDADKKHYVGGNDSFKARFSCETDNAELFVVESGSCRVTVSAEANGKQKNKWKTPKAHKKNVKGVEKTSSLAFEDIQQGIDYEYSVIGNGIKENIVVKEKGGAYRFPFVMHMENVVARFDKQGNRIAFNSTETGDEVFFIPAPFMYDAKGIISTDVSYDFKIAKDGDAILTVIADSAWMNSKSREFPVMIDPQIQLSGTSAMSTYSWEDGDMYNSLMHTVGTVKIDSEEAGSEVSTTETAKCSLHRMYMSFNMPTLPRNPRIKKAELKFFQQNGVSECGCCHKIGLYQVSDAIVPGVLTPTNDDKLIDFARIKVGHCEDGEVISYTFDVTTLVDQFNKGETTTPRLVLKMIDECHCANNYVTLCGSTYSDANAPQFVITYESTYGVNTSYRTHTHEIGRFGQGSIDLQCGNLMFESEDFAWAGNRMPVTLKHLYTSALADTQFTANSGIKLQTADFSTMKLGLGYKLNIMQSLIATTFQYDGEVYEGYVCVGENGEETYFKKSDKTCCCKSNKQCYHLYEDIDSGAMLYDPIKLTLTSGSEIYLFDSTGKLVQIKNEYDNHMDITYTSGRITSVIDGAGREFAFAYDANGFLTSITAPDSTRILYSYTGNLLTQITYQDGRKVLFTYDTNDKPATVILKDAAGIEVYKIVYTFNGDRVVAVAEYGVENGTFAMGARSEYEYSVASGRTIVETLEQADEDDLQNNIIKTVYTFDDEGNVISEYAYTDDFGNTGVEGSSAGINPYVGESGMGIASNVNNLLVGHSFETLDVWTSTNPAFEELKITNYAQEPHTKYGKKLLCLESSSTDCANEGVYQTTSVLPVGDYTFSAYVRGITDFVGENNPGVYIKVTTTEGTFIAESEHIRKRDSEFARLIVPFKLETAQSVKVQILVNGKGIVHVDAVQLENNPYANAYNILENSNFENDGGWTLNNAEYSSEDCFNMSRSLKIDGNIHFKNFASQIVPVKTSRATRETFTLSGWAKGYGLPTHERDGITTPTFRLRAEIKYFDKEYSEYDTETFTADFSPCTEEWQFASVEFSKSKFRIIKDVTVYCDYGFNFGTAYFDDIQLTRSSLETYLSASDFAVESTGTDEEETQSGTDEIVENTTPTFEESLDQFGNALTETTFTDGEFGTIYKAFEFNSNGTDILNAGNDLVAEIDARGNKTEHVVDADTSRQEEVVDRCGNKTTYEYDVSGKTTKITSKDADDTELSNVAYAYDAFDNMTEIARGDGLKYSLAYNAYHNLESIGINGKAEKLIRYDYKNGNGRLKQITYANGSTMKATYNSAGQMVAEKWFDASNTLVAHYKYVYDKSGNIIRSIDIFALKEYNYEYDGGKIVRATECDITLDTNGVVVSKTLVNTVIYSYDNEGSKNKERIIAADGTERIIYTENSEDDTVVKFLVGGKTITNHSKTDSFGRKVFDELQLGTGFVSRQFQYLNGEITDEHKDAAKLKSSATTQLVSQIVISSGRIISYEYDAEERITKVIDSVDGTTEYTYDALGQLLTEVHNGTTVNTMTYDDYGNILSKNGIAYSYGNAVWKDLLTGYGNESITYDAQGNPISYLGHTLTWEKGRQLKSFDGIQYTYNANGIRTSKTVDGVKHTYILNGANILREEWDNNVLIPLYDNEGSVCGIIYNDEPFYFQKNLQGDVIGIVDKDAQVVARYSYDAWGVCTIFEDVSECSIATVNPYRYRGYYYDNEIGLYYLQSRYYNPNVGRFINSDDAEWLGTGSIALEKNLFSYCKNDCINGTDDSGFGGVDALLNVLGSCVDVIINIIEMIGNSYNKEKKKLESSVKLLSKKQKLNLSEINSLKDQTKKLSKRLGWIGHAITFLTIIIGFIASYRTGGNIDHSIIELIIESFVAIVEYGAGKFFGLIAKFIPYVGFLLSLLAGWLVTYLLGKYFNKKRMKKIKKKFSSFVKDVRISILSWTKNAVKSLSA